MAVNKSGDWIAIACGKGTEGQLVVWEWQSETYVMKQQSHSQSITTVAYSPDGSQIATGAEDGKVWSLCFYHIFKYGFSKKKRKILILKVRLLSF